MFWRYREGILKLVRNYILFTNFFPTDIRGNNLDKDDAVDLKCALVHMPNLEVLDISDNPLEDDGIGSV